MEDWTRVVLYGTYDGFTRSTDGLHRIVVVLEGGERVEVPSEYVMSADQIVKKDKIKLKDVIERIKSFDVDAREAWLNEILNGLGSDFSSKKYRDGYEQGKFEGKWVGQQLKDADKVRQELNKPVVKQFVADWYEENKDDFETKLFRAVESFSTPYEEDDPTEFLEWLVDGNNKPIQTLVNMHQFGYTVEKEPKYTVKIKSVNQYLVRNTDEDFLGFLQSRLKSKFTRKELEEAGFGEVFNSPLFEVEEVDE